MGGPLHRQWMYKKRNPDGQLRNEWLMGVNMFDEFARNQEDYKIDGVYRCPCVKCKNMQYLTPDVVKSHLYTLGFKENYWYWTSHGEEENSESFGPSLHTCGSISTSERKRRLAKTLGKEPTFEELSKDIHCKAKDKSFVDKKSEKNYEEYHNQWNEYSQAATQEGSQLPPMTPEEFWSKENLDKKGRVYSFGMEGIKLKKSATIAAARHSSGEHFDPRAQAQLLNESIAKQVETISQIAKKQGKTERMMKKVLRFLKEQSAGSSSQANLNTDEEHDSQNDADDLMNLSDSD